MTSAGTEKAISEMVRGVGPAAAKAVVRSLGAAALDRICGDPDEVDRVDGLSRRQRNALREAARSRGTEMRTKAVLFSLGAGPALADKLWRKYGPQAALVATGNPYALIGEIPGMGFPTADKMARAAGLRADSPQRLEHGLEHVLRTETEKGHVFLPVEEWKLKAADLLNVPPERLGMAVQSLTARKRVRVRKNRAYLPRLLKAERRVARRLAALSRTGAPPNTADLAREAFRDAGTVPTSRQLEAVRAATGGGLVVVTGGPGTGKTTVLNAMMRAYRMMGLRPALAAPTGKAARRMSEAAGAPASTIHRLVYERRGSWDALVVDEASMLDLQLAEMLLKVHPKGAPLVLVGDPDQLPPVDPGDVLGELIRSGAARVVRLDRVFRQGAGSGVATLARDLIRGAPVWNTIPAWKGEPADVIFIERENPGEVFREVVRWAAEVLPGLGFDPGSDIQVLSPFNKGPLGADALNRRLRDILNPPRGLPEAGWRGKRFRAGDKVIRTKNSHQLEVYNGDPGVVADVVRIHPRRPPLVMVDHDGRIVEYEPAELAHLSQAWALSIHKAQGSEYEAVVLPLATQHYILLSRQLLYTAITRARKIVVLVGDRRAMLLAARNRIRRERRTALAERIRRAAKPR